jgi:hypothetical protein
MRTLLLLVLLPLSACVSMMQANPGMRGSEAYARAHRGEGTRRAFAASRKEIRDGLVEGWSKSEGMDVAEEGDAIFATTTKVDFTYAVYFSPAAAAGQTEVEILMASPWLKPEDLRGHEVKLLDGLAKGLAAKRASAPKAGAAASSGAPAPPQAPARARPSEPLPKPDKKFDSQL